MKLEKEGDTYAAKELWNNPEAGTAFIVSSHLLSLIEDLCTTILVLHRGRQLLYERLSDLRARTRAMSQHAVDHLLAIWESL